MTQAEARSLVSFLVNCSRTSLGNFLIAKQSVASNLEKELRELIARLVENVAFIELANILRDHGEEIVGSHQDGGTAEMSASPNLVPMNWWHWILQRKDLTPSDRLVAIAIKSFSNREGESAPHVLDLMERTALSRAQVYRGMAKLQQKGILVSRRTGRGNRMILRYQVETSEVSNSDLRGLSQRPQRSLVETSEVSHGDSILISENLEVPGKATPPYPPRKFGGGDRVEHLCIYGQTIEIQMGRKHRLPNTNALIGARADSYVDFFSSRGFPAKIIKPEEMKAKA
jgi:Helix-turn-helix domain